MLIWSQTSFVKAKELFEEGKYTLAKPLFESYLKEKPADKKTIEYLGDIAGHQKQWDTAIMYYKKLKTQFPATANYHYKFGGAYAMKAKNSNKFSALGMIDEIEEAFLTASKLDAKHIETRWALVMFYIELPGIFGGSESKAQKYANELLKISPVDGCMSKGYIDEYFGRYTSAEKQYIKAIEIGQSKTTYQKLANLYKNKMNSPQKAKATMDEFENRKG